MDPSWEASELYSVGWHPLRDISSLRAGRFSAVVLRSAEEGIISWQTAAEYVRCSEEDLHLASQGVRELFPTVFPASVHP